MNTPNLMLDILLAQVCQSEFDFQKDLSMKITSETKEGSSIIHRMQNKTLHFKIAHARYACLCLSSAGQSLKCGLDILGFPRIIYYVRKF